VREAGWGGEGEGEGLRPRFGFGWQMRVACVTRESNSNGLSKETIGSANCRNG